MRMRPPSSVTGVMSFRHVTLYLLFAIPRLSAINVSKRIRSPSAIFHNVVRVGTDSDRSIWLSIALLTPVASDRSLKLNPNFNLRLFMVAPKEEKSIITYLTISKFTPALVYSPFPLYGNTFCYCLYYRAYRNFLQLISFPLDKDEDIRYFLYSVRYNRLS